VSILKILTLFLIVSTFPSFSQDKIIHKILSNKRVLKTLVIYEILKPSKYIISNKTEKWNNYRFQVSNYPDANIADEHHPFNHTYFFKDKKIAKLFSTEQTYLYEKSMRLNPKKIKILPIKGFKIVDEGYKTHKEKVLIKLSEPVFSKNQLYVFIELKAYFNQELYSVEGLILKKENGKWNPFFKVGGMYM
jgi:hypothetical protein